MTGKNEDDADESVLPEDIERASQRRVRVVVDVPVEMQKHVCIILKVLKRLKFHRSSSLKRLHCVSFFFLDREDTEEGIAHISQLATKLQTTTHTCNPACRWVTQNFGGQRDPSVASTI